MTDPERKLLVTMLIACTAGVCIGVLSVMLPITLTSFTIGKMIVTAIVLIVGFASAGRADKNFRELREILTKER